MLIVSERRLPTSHSKGFCSRKATRLVRDLSTPLSQGRFFIARFTPPMPELTIRLHIEPLDEGGYVATSPDVPGLVAEGCSLTETAAIAQELAREIAQCCLDHGDPLPPAFRRLENAKSFKLVVPVELP